SVPSPWTNSVPPAPTRKPGSRWIRRSPGRNPRSGSERRCWKPKEWPRRPPRRDGSSPKTRGYAPTWRLKLPLRTSVWTGAGSLLRSAPSGNAKSREVRSLPAAAVPLGQAGAFRTQRGVAAMPRVDPRVVVHLVEDAGLHVSDQAAEIRVAPGFSDPAGKEAVPGEQVSVPSGVVVTQRDRAGSVSPQVDHGEGAGSHGDRVTVFHEFVGGYGKFRRVRGVGDSPRTGGPGHVGESAPVVPVAVGGDHPGQAVVADKFEQAVGFGSGVDEDRFPGPHTAQEVSVVVHRADR